MNDDDYIGKRFGTRVCIGHYRKSSGRLFLVVQCDCGLRGVISARKVKYHGCRKCKVRQIHGHAHGTPTYRSWSSMLNRCMNEKHQAYSRYGGRGITVCDKWMSFTGFLEDMGERPPGRSLDRIDNDGNYTKENCRWASNAEQCNNKSNCVMVSINGRLLNVTQWAIESGISRFVLYERIRRGWPPERLLSPVRPLTLDRR